MLTRATVLDIADDVIVEFYGQEHWIFTHSEMLLFADRIINETEKLLRESCNQNTSED